MIEGNRPWLDVTPSIALRLAASVALMGAGMHYLSTGRKEADVSRMMTGAVLALASVFISF